MSGRCCVARREGSLAKPLGQALLAVVPESVTTTTDSNTDTGAKTSVAAKVDSDEALAAHYQQAAICCLISNIGLAWPQSLKSSEAKKWFPNFFSKIKEFLGEDGVVSGEKLLDMAYPRRADKIEMTGKAKETLIQEIVALTLPLSLGMDPTSIDDLPQVEGPERRQWGGMLQENLPAMIDAIKSPQFEQWQRLCENPQRTQMPYDELKAELKIVFEDEAKEKEFKEYYQKRGLYTNSLLLTLQAKGYEKVAAFWMDPKNEGKSRPRSVGFLRPAIAQGKSVLVKEFGLPEILVEALAAATGQEPATTKGNKASKKKPMSAKKKAVVKRLRSKPKSLKK